MKDYKSIIFSMFSIILCLFFLFGIPVKAAKYGNYEYEEKNGTIEITKFSGLDKSLTIPSTIAGKKVTSIGENAFEWSLFEKVTIPNTVTVIKSCAFINCDGMKTITVPKSVTSIGYFAFGFREYMDSSADCEKIEGVAGFIIYGYPGSAAEKYAKEHGIKFVSIDTSSTEPQTPVVPQKPEAPVKIGATYNINKNKYVVTSATTVRYKNPASKK